MLVELGLDHSWNWFLLNAMSCRRYRIVKAVFKSCNGTLYSVSVHFFISSLFFFFLPILFLSTFLHHFTVRRMLWPLWPLTLRLSAYHLGAGQEVGVKKRAQVKPNRNASTSPTSPFASETQTFVRCSGYGRIASSLPLIPHIPTPYCYFKSS